MPNSTHLIRRNRYYSWRKRGAWGVLQLAIGTDDLALARRAGAAATLEAMEVIEMMQAGLIQPDEARSRIAEAVRAEIARTTMTAALARARERSEFLLRAAVGAMIPQPVAPPAAVPAARPVKEEVAPAEAEGRDASILAVAERLCRTLARTSRANEKTCRQIMSTAALFSEATGVQDVRRVRQGHVADFVDLLDQLPPTYRKSPAEREMPLRQIAQEAADRGAKQGLSVATINRTLTQLHQILDAADAEGLHIDTKLKVARLKRKDRVAEKDKRLPFTDDDVRAIFESPVFHGSKSVHRRWTPGPHVIRDAVFWAPLIAVYTGARREEIAGMMREEIIEWDGQWAFDIRENDERGIKSDAGSRLIPVHPHLLELGLLDHVASGRLLPDLHRKSDKSSLGDALDYRWRQLQTRTVEDNEKKSFHSFRHHFVNLIERHGKDLSERTKNELSGHAQQGTRNRVYGSEADFYEKQVFINRIPRVF